VDCLDLACVARYMAQYADGRTDETSDALQVAEYFDTFQYIL